MLHLQLREKAETRDRSYAIERHLVRIPWWTAITSSASMRLCGSVSILVGAHADSRIVG